MADPYYKYAPLSRDPRSAVPGYLPSEGSAQIDPRSSAFPGYLPSEGSAQIDPRSSAFPGYLTSEVSALASRQFLDASNLRTAAEFPQTEMLSSRSRYGVDDLPGIGNHVPPGTGGLVTRASLPGVGNHVSPGTAGLVSRAGLPGIGNHVSPGTGGLVTRASLPGIGNHVSPGTGGLVTGASMRAVTGASMRPFTPSEDPTLPRRDVVLAVKPGGVDFERNEPLRKSEGLLSDESNMLFVEGLPNDCTRREVAHLFRPFIGFKEIRVVHKEAKRPEDKAYALCFVEFNDSKCALTALEALQGYMFDEKKSDAAVLRIQFAKFPFHPPNP